MVYRPIVLAGFALLALAGCETRAVAPPPGMAFASAEVFSGTPAEVVIQDAGGDDTVLYRESHALVIGAADYKHPSWNDLRRVPGEVDKVTSVLRAHGFDVETVLDPSGDELRRAIHRFVVEHGFTRANGANADNRLLIFFSGHGHTRPNDRGYLVPVDAPDPVLDEAGFLDKALDMIEVMGWARRIEAKHALFVFDSCFSGTLFETKARPRPGEAYIRASTAKPVRQFITAGDAGQEVPAASIFTPLFLEALEGTADTNDDGYVTGLELGLHLMQTVPDHNPEQTPQYGKIHDHELDDGDFVFVKTIPFELALIDPNAAEGVPGLTRVGRQHVQRALNQQGYGTGPVDGIFGPKTREAIRSWQGAMGLRTTGYLDERQV